MSINIQNEALFKDKLNKDRNQNVEGAIATINATAPFLNMSGKRVSK